MRIAVLTSTYPHGPSMAAAPFLPPFLDELTRLGHEPVTFFPRIGAEAPTSADEIPIEWTARPRPLVSLSPSRPHEAALIFRLLRRWQARVAEEHSLEPFDIALALWAVPAGWVGRRLQRSLGLPYAVWTLGSDINMYGRKVGLRHVVAVVLRDAAAVFANSNVLARRVEEISGREAEFLATSRPIESPARLAPMPAGTNFLFVGRLESVKGVDVLVEAAARLASRTGGWHLTIAGDGSLKRELVGHVGSQQSLSGRVTFTGHLDGERLLSYLYACDCVVVPSRSESMPVVVSEAMQAGKRLIVTDVGDMGELVGRNALGEVVPSDDAPALAAALKRLAGHASSEVHIDPDLLRLFDITRSAGRFCEVTGEILQERASARPK